MQQKSEEGFRVFWYLMGDGPMSAHFTKAELNTALRFMEELRKDSMNVHIVLSSHNKDSVGKPGVDSVVGGKTPDGVDYDWSKADRAGKMRKSDQNKPASSWIEP